jgi:hypothetical protein
MVDMSRIAIYQTMVFSALQTPVSSQKSKMARPLISRALGVIFSIVALAGSPAAQGVPRLDSYEGVAVRILQSNNAGNIHHIIDPAVNRVVGIIRGCPHAHNLTVHPDGLYYYVRTSRTRPLTCSTRKRSGSFSRSSCRRR